MGAHGAWGALRRHQGPPVKFKRPFPHTLRIGFTSHSRNYPGSLSLCTSPYSPHPLHLTHLAVPAAPSRHAVSPTLRTALLARGTWAQANYFVDAVNGAGGLNSNTMQLVLDLEDDDGVGPDATWAFVQVCG